MSCVKCGKKVEDNSVFCPECLEEMERYPVKPGTPVYIPVRPEPTERKQVRIKKERTPEEQIASLHKWVRWLLILVVALTTALVLATGALVYTLTDTLDTQPAETTDPQNNITAAVAEP